MRFAYRTNQATIIKCFYEWGCRNPHNLASSDGSLTLFHKCTYLKNFDSYLFQYGQNLSQNEYQKEVQKLQRQIRRLSIEIKRWSKLKGDYRGTFNV